MSDDRYEVDGADGAYIIVERASGTTVGAFVAVDGEPGWWRGVVRGVVRRLFVPAADPVDMAGRFLHR